MIVDARGNIGCFGMFTLEMVRWGFAFGCSPCRDRFEMLFNSTLVPTHISDNTMISHNLII